MNARRVIRTWLSALLWGLAVLLGLDQAAHAEALRTSNPQFSRDELLSNAGRDWLDAHGPIRLGVPSVPWPPFDMFSPSGEYRGISADYLALLKQRLGFQVEEVRFGSFGETLDALREGRIDAMPSMARTPEREAFAVFTLPYIRSQPVIICRKDDHSIHALSDLAGKTVAIEKGFAARDYLEGLAGISFLDYVGTKEALEAVSLGKANAYVGSLISSTYIIDREAMSNLEVRSASGLPISDIRFAVNKNDPELARLLDHGIASISEQEHDAINKRWIGVAGLGIDWWAVARIAIPVGGALISTILVILIWNSRLHRQVARRRAAEEALGRQMSFQLALLENLPVLVAYKDPEARFIGCNRAYEEAFGVAREDLVGKTTLDIGGFPDGQRKRGYTQDLEVLRTGVTLHRQEQIMFIDGEEHDILLWRIPFKLTDGTSAGLISISIDVSEQKEAERALADQLLYQRTLLDTVPNPLYIKDKDARFIGCNRAYEEAFGTSREELVGKTVHELPHIRPEMRQAFYEADREILQTRKPVFRAERLPFRDGIRDTLFWINSFDLADGSVGGLVDAIVDVSEQKALERQAQEAERRLREITDNIPGAVYQIRAGADGALDYAFVSEGIRSLRGLSREQVLADFDACMAQVFAEDRPGLKATIGKALSELVPVEHEYRIRLPDKSVKWLRSAAAPNRQADGSTVLNGFSVDITAQKEAAHALAEAERRLREMANSVPGVVYQLRIAPDGSRSYTFMSDAVQALRGYSREDALADYQSLFDQVVEEDKPVIDRAMSAAVSSSALAVMEFRIRMPDGAIKWLQSGAVPIRADDGAVVLNGYWIDVTAHREMERELAEAQAAADAANRAKSSFLAAMSHEIRTPMNGVLGMLELLSLTRLDREQRANLEVIRDSGRSLLRIVDDILDFSKIEAGMLDLRPEPTAIADLVRGVRDVYSGAASAKRLTLAANSDPTISPALMVDPLRLRQILNNFVSNALKFTTEGSVTIGAVLAESGGDTDTVQFTVADTGIGISPENQQKLFQPFVQAESDTTRRFGGTGLGLVICRRLADLMGGAIDMDSALGRGTTMRLVVTLTRVDPALIAHATETRSVSAITLEQRRAAPDADNAVAEGTLVLVADDHPTNRLLIKRQLNLLGYAAETAENGKEAFDAWRSGRFGLLITDCHMPEMDGYEMTRLIRKAEAGNGAHRTPILACTANVLEGEAEACLQAGMDGYLPKPVELPVLVAALDCWLPLPEAARPEPPAELPAAGATANGADNGPIDFAKLAEMSGGDKAFERELLADFRNAADEDAKELGAALESGNCDQITRVAHRLKGASRTVGATDLATLSERMEMAARSSDQPAIGAIRDSLFHEVERLRSHLAKL